MDFNLGFILTFNTPKPAAEHFNPLIFQATCGDLQSFPVSNISHGKPQEPRTKI